MINKQSLILSILLIALTLLATFDIEVLRADDSATSWSSLTPMPTPRGGIGLAVANGKIFAIGGLIGDNQPVGTTEEYNPATNQWTNKIPMPTARTGFATAVYQGRIYVIGGSVGNNGYVGNNEVYDPVTNTWQTKASMPTPRADLSANIVGDKIYLIGGKRYSSSFPFYAETNLTEVYDILTDTWTTKESIPTAVQGYGSAVVNDSIYIIGGSRVSTSSGSSIIVSNNQVYNTQNDSWSLGAALPDGASYGAVAVTQGFMAPSLLYFVGGFHSGEYTGETQIYNYENNSWALGEPMPSPRGYLGLVVLNDILYAIGGFDGQAWLGTNEQYKPLGYGTIPPNVEIISPENKTYAESTLDFTVNRNADWIGYSLDSQANITVKSEINLSNLTDGQHWITVYANDSLGNMGISNTVFFSIDTQPPIINILVPQNRTYDSIDLQLTFTLNEVASNISYSLDEQDQISIIGNVTLPALSNGSHHLTLYATDETGNSGEITVVFSISLFPVLPVAAGVTIAIIAIASAYILFKRRDANASKEKS